MLPSTAMGIPPLPRLSFRPERPDFFFPAPQPPLVIPSEAARFSLPRRILARRAAERGLCAPCASPGWRDRSTIAGVPQPAVLLTPLFSDLCVTVLLCLPLPFLQLLTLNSQLCALPPLPPPTIALQYPQVMLSRLGSSQQVPSLYACSVGGYSTCVP